MSCSKLSENDREVVGRIFSPHNPYAITLDDIGDSCNADKSDSSAAESEADKLAHSIELEAVHLAEANRIDDAIALFCKAIDASPTYASAYNNRAQANRIAGNNDAAISDLEVAIRLSNDTGKVARQAHTQRALLRRLAGDEEGARADFERAAQLGSEFARNQAVALNPYAALCSNMLTKMFRQVTEGKPSDCETND